MIIENPIWYLKTLCPHCDQGFPAFYCCPNCNFLTVFCLETDDMFINPNNLAEGFTDICPICKKASKDDFTLADSDKILSEGFTKEQYH